MKSTRLLLLLGTVVLCCACAQQPQIDDVPSQSIRWVRDSAEYRALSRQTYRAASLALPGMIADKNWSALPDQVNAGDLPPALILDVDETALTNPVFQMSFERPFTDKKLNDWSIAHDATPVPGAAEFLRHATDAGVAVFFVTNRPCVPDAGGNDPCPQKPVVISDLVEAGLPANVSNTFLSGERPEWGKEKMVRRNWVAENYRVIMLIGDDLSDFIPCVRRRPAGPCTEGGTIANRYALTDEHDAYWGAGWFILPNPMHGSWTSIK